MFNFQTTALINIPATSTINFPFVEIQNNVFTEIHQIITEVKTATMHSFQTLYVQFQVKFQLQINTYILL